MSSAVVWDGARWVAPGAGVWWDGERWQSLIVEVGGYSVTADAQLWYDGQRWRAVDRRPRRSFVWTLLSIEAVFLLLGGPILAWMAAGLVAACPGPECSIAADGWFLWLLFAGMILTPSLVLMVQIVRAIRKRRRPVTTPAALLDLLETDSRFKSRF